MPRDSYGLRATGRIGDPKLAGRLRREIADAYRQQSQNRAEELRGIADVGYREGELGILELLDSYRVEQQARLRLLELQAAAKLAEVELDRALGKEVLP